MQTPSEICVISPGAPTARVAAVSDSGASGPILAIACGMFVYIAVFDLMPDLVRARSRAAAVAGIVGIAIVLALS